MHIVLYLKNIQNDIDLGYDPWYDFTKKIK